jgi:biotin transport system substrate-specific component
MKSINNIRMMVYASLFAALTAAGAFLAIPVGPVPIALQNLFVFLAGLLLGARWGVWSVAIYLLTGAMGLPIFAGGTGGIAKFAGPTGGYLIGYLPAVFVIGVLTEKLPKKPVFTILALAAGALIVYACGVPWLKAVTGMAWPKALSAGLYPFLPGDALKIVAALPLSVMLKDFIRK